MTRVRAVLIAIAVAAVLFAIRGPLLMAAPACLELRWHGCLSTENGVVLVTVVGIGPAFLVAWLLARRRGGQWRRSVAEVGMVYGTVPWVWLTLMPGSGAGTVPGRLSLVPFQDLATMTPLGIGGNLLVLASLGFFGPVRFAGLASVSRVGVLGAGCSLLIEVSQYAFQLDRVSSVDDVLINTTGAVLAALASRRWWCRVDQDAAVAA